MFVIKSWPVHKIIPMIHIYNFHLQGIEAAPLKDNNMFEISAKILGLSGSQWEGCDNIVINKASEI